MGPGTVGVAGAVGVGVGAGAGGAEGEGVGLAVGVGSAAPPRGGTGFCGDSESTTAPAATTRAPAMPSAIMVGRAMGRR